MVLVVPAVRVVERGGFISVNVWDRNGTGKLVVTRIWPSTTRMSVTRASSRTVSPFWPFTNGRCTTPSHTRAMSESASIRPSDGDCASSAPSVWSAPSTRFCNDVVEAPS